MSKFDDSDLIINYHDAVIYGSDLKLFNRRSEWLNDSCIHFYFAFLQQQQKYQRQQQQQKEGELSFLFMDPSVVSFWIHQCTDQDDIKEFVNNIDFPGKDGTSSNSGGVIFVPVNDNMSNSSNSWQTPNSGSHWSLLLIVVGCDKNECNNNDKDDSDSEDDDKNDNDDDSEVTLRFWHFDSIRNSGNIRAAQDIAERMRLHVYPGKKNKENSDTMKVIQAETPQQLNGYDCGVHVLGAAKIFASTIPKMINNYSGNNKFDNFFLDSLDDALRKVIGKCPLNFCSKLRNEISSEILRLRQEKLQLLSTSK
mmetsp:Transcript_37222/g.41934  ORF Transcript_37222/g.41934 Transcript_37222/m.41934 type:complete len:309 (-) Transcript_37222:3-929(-)